MDRYLNGPPVSKGVLWAGRIVSLLVALLFIFSASMKFIQPPGFTEGLEHMGWNAATMFYIGIVELTCAILYMIPRTSVLGAILLTAYMGGAIASHVRVGDPFYTQIVIGILIWLGLFLRETRIRDLIPIKG